jgi:hypothetical protein
MSALNFRILHDRKQTTVLFCIAVCDTYAVGVTNQPICILLNLFFLFLNLKNINVTLAELMS